MEVASIFLLFACGTRSVSVAKARHRVLMTRRYQKKYYCEHIPYSDTSRYMGYWAVYGRMVRDPYE